MNLWTALKTPFAWRSQGVVGAWLREENMIDGRRRVTRTSRGGYIPRPMWVDEGNGPGKVFGQ